MPPKNPWTNISWKNTIADCDKNAVQKYLVGFGEWTVKTQIHNEMLPEPFIGDLGANVYLLNGNPGLSTSDLSLVNDSTFEKQIQDTLNQVLKSFMWFQKSTSIIYKDLHSGYNWWNRVMKEVLKKKAHPRICNIEYYPYHSYSIPAGLPYLPSNTYVDWYINDAIDNGKWIIIMRCEKKWLLRIPRLKSYKNKFVCSSVRNNTISPQNLLNAAGSKITSSDWKTLLSLM